MKNNAFSGVMVGVIVSSAVDGWIEPRSGGMKDDEKGRPLYLIDLIYCVITPLSAIFQLYHGDQF